MAAKRSTSRAVPPAVPPSNALGPETPHPSTGLPPTLGTFPVEMWGLDRLQRYPNNPRRNEAAIAKVAQSIQTFGWRVPIVVDEAGVILAGDTRYLAAQLLQLPAVPVHQALGLTEAQKRAFRLADNRVAQEAEWDESRLIAELQALQAVGLEQTTGFETEEIAELLDIAIGGIQPHADPEVIPPLPKIPKTQVGDLYLLGPHRVLCADATQSDAWQRLLEGRKAQALWTDPPYDVDYQGGTKDKLTIQNDNLGHAGTVKLLRALLGLALIHLEEGGAVYVCAPHGPQFYAFAVVGTELGFWRQTLLWIKDSFAFGRSDYHYRHEAILTTEGPMTEREVEAIGYGWRPGKAHTWHGGRKQDTGWEVDRPRTNEDHPTAKPVELVARALRASTKAGDLVVDCCAGGGSLLIACEMEHRIARCIEIDPRYVDAIVSRWEALTGRQAQLVRLT